MNGDTHAHPCPMRNALYRIDRSRRIRPGHQGLGDWYPDSIGVPDSSIGVLVRTPAEAIEEIRLQVKNRVDLIKVTVDGLHRNPANGGGNAGLLREGTNVGRVATGALADLTVCRADPLKDIKSLQQRENIAAIYLGGKEVDRAQAGKVTTYQWEHSFRQWNDTYTRARVAALVR